MSDIIPHDSKMAMRQVGWLGFTGKYYPIGTTFDEIHATEKGGYGPVYEQVGTWYWNETAKDWRVEYD